MGSTTDVLPPALPPVSVAPWTQSTATPALTRGDKAARDFETYLVGSLLESLEQTFASVPGETTMPGQDEYGYLGRQALASAVSDAGGFGIAKMIREYFARHESNSMNPSGVPVGVAGQR